MAGDPPELVFDEDVSTDPGVARLVDGRFRIVREIARGGMSVVYLAEQEAVERHVALKLLRLPKESEGTDWNFLDRFRDEARRLASFQHPNVVTLYDYGETEGGGVFLAMEFVDGPRLSDLIRKGPLDTVRVVRLLEQVAHALRYTHQRGVIHRDISPANILITTDADGLEQPKLIDFGISAESGGLEDEGDVIVGSPSCMAPEQILGTDLDHRVDVYALGVVAFRALVGRYPYRGADVTDTLRMHLDAPVPSLKRAVASAGGGRHVPDALDDLVTRCLAKAREDRPADMDVVLELVRSLRQEIDPDRTRTLHLQPADLSRERTRPGVVLLMAALAAMVGAAAMWGVQSTRDASGPGETLGDKVAPNRMGAPAEVAGPASPNLAPSEPGDPSGGSEHGDDARTVDDAEGPSEGGAAEEAVEAAPEAGVDQPAPGASQPSSGPRPSKTPVREPRRSSKEPRGGTSRAPQPAPERSEGAAEPPQAPKEETLDVPSGYKGMPEF